MCKVTLLKEMQWSNKRKIKKYSIYLRNVADQKQHKHLKVVLLCSTGVNKVHDGFSLFIFKVPAMSLVPHR